ncbi:hypothetical protein [Streptomyces sp. NBC_00893]|uniref:hypothetical protein n=1 Tax=Streptomyces sp. NBC_00893 TaxID=2975862 RepID=UPI00225A11B9|nr:hypothetical protein [Streptomyces sp. NBC_00893]MCX4845970.1 hypothetical protein [Streptomyces sp. NBC_00893]
MHELLGRLPVHWDAFAYVKGRSVVDCARRHLGAQWLIKIDISDFFGSVGERRVHQVFRTQGLSAAGGLRTVAALHLGRPA